MSGQAQALAVELGERLSARGQCLALAESCTGGLVAKLVTDVTGSSRWFERGLVTYSNLAKQELLGVPEGLLARFGAVSGECVLAMASGLLARAPVDWAVAITGIAGPGGGTPDKPVGTVWLAWQARGAAPEARQHHFAGDREAVREQAAAVALTGLIERLG